MESTVKSEVKVKNETVRILRIGETEYISLTDLARYANPEEPKITIQTWMRNKGVILYLGLWEKLNNKGFKGHEFTTFESSAGKPRWRIAALCEKIPRRLTVGDLRFKTLKYQLSIDGE